jgi:hypothetical protein
MRWGALQKYSPVTVFRSIGEAFHKATLDLEPKQNFGRLWL